VGTKADFVQGLNNYVGALLLAATIALVTVAIKSYAADVVQDQRIASLEQFQQQQFQINASVSKLSETVAVMGERQTHINKAIETLAAR
jgi:uncharacterized protein YlxW (UPF0749 family)